MDAQRLRRRTLSEAKGHGEISSVIHGSPIGKPYPSSVASLRSLDFSNLANWNILVAKGREINRDPVSSGERERIGGFQKKKDEALFIDWSRSSSNRSVGSSEFLSKVWTWTSFSFSPGFIRFVVDWMMEKPASRLTFHTRSRVKEFELWKGWKIWPKKVIAL